LAAVKLVSVPLLPHAPSNAESESSADATNSFLLIIFPYRPHPLIEYVQFTSQQVSYTTTLVCAAAAQKFFDFIKGEIHLLSLLDKLNALDGFRRKNSVTAARTGGTRLGLFAKKRRRIRNDPPPFFI